MLRNGLIVFALLLICGGLAFTAAGTPGSWPMAFWGCVLLAAVVFERWRYRQKQATAGGGWQATEERFVDPETGQLTQVLYNARSGERSYKVIGADAGPPQP